MEFDTGPKACYKGRKEALGYLDMSLDFCQNPVLQIDAEDWTGYPTRLFSHRTSTLLCNEGL